MSYFSHRSKGFTLLELLVVIAIISILIAMGAVAFSTAQSKSRDAKRRADVKVMQNAFEQYYADNTGYDADCNVMLGDTTYLPGGAPVDPQNVTPNVYSCSSTSTTYCLCAGLEDDTTGNSSDDACAYGSGAYYCLSNLQ
ncbi:MAG: type II secretion system GspH family protein [bacterium]|nr:type II secretion system GspH family protein [bacterium]